MPASRKIHVTGTRPDIRVAMREVTLSGGEPPIRLYDTSGPYTDPDTHTDIKMGLTPMRLPWILGRADVDELSGPSSLYRRDRESAPALDGQEHPRDARVDPAQLPGPHRHGADLPGARESRRQGRGSHLGALSRHADRAGRAGRRLLHDPRRRAPALHPAHREACDRHR